MLTQRSITYSKGHARITQTTRESNSQPSRDNQPSRLLEVNRGENQETPHGKKPIEKAYLGLFYGQQYHLIVVEMLVEGWKR